MSLPLQRGQTSVGEVRNTSDSRCMSAVMTPVVMFAAPAVSFGLAKRFTMHTGTPAAKSANGGPSVPPFTWSVAVWFSAQAGFVLASHPARHMRTSVPKTIGKIGERPGPPFARCAPSGGTDHGDARGPPPRVARDLTG